MWGDKDSGFYFASEALFWRMDNPIKPQIIAFRGFVDEAGLLRGRGQIITVNDADAGGRFLNVFFFEQGEAGNTYGGGAPALSADQVDSETFGPGLRLTLGYRLQNDIAIEFVYWRMVDYRNTASAGILPPDLNVGNDLATAFLTAPFFNFPSSFAGPSRDVVSSVVPVPVPPGLNTINVGATTPAPANNVLVSAAELADLRTLRGLPLAAYGIWNAAEDMTIELRQQVWGSEITGRFPLFQSECNRTYALVGPRYVQVQERFRLRTVDNDTEGESLPVNAATYTNLWENRFYGGQCGLGTETYLGRGFALSLEGRVGIFARTSYTNVKVERGDRTNSIEVDETDAGVSPMFQVGAFLWWYPLEGIQVRCGYELFGIMNTLRSDEPVDFNVGRLRPDFSERLMRFDGMSLGVAFIF